MDRKSSDSRRSVFGIEFAKSDLAGTVQKVVAPTLSQDPMRLVLTANVDNIVNLQINQNFREVYRRASIITIDGAPLMVYARLRGLAVPQRVTGADLFPRVLEALDISKHRVFMVAADEFTYNKLRDQLIERGMPSAAVAGGVPKFGFEKDEVETGRLRSQIIALRPTHIFFGVGSPKSELWALRNEDVLNGATVVCVGAALQFQAGSASRAPRLVRAVGMEWAWRLYQEPRRLWRRYLFGAGAFAMAIGRDLRGHWPSP